MSLDNHSEELDLYVDSHSSRESSALHELWRKANIRLLNGHMTSGHLQGRFLRMLIELSGARRVLEIGTFCGYSALCMAEGLPQDGIIDTIEVDDELEPFIRSEAMTLPGGEKIRLHIGDACDVMRTLEPPYDFIFIDGDKRQYTAYLKEALRLLSPTGLIVADNTLWYGHVVDRDYDNDRQTLGVRDFNDTVASDPDLEKVILPLRDGLTLIRRAKHNGPCGVNKI